MFTRVLTFKNCGLFEQNAAAHLYVRQFVRAFCKRFIKRIRRAVALAIVDPISGLHSLDCFISGDEFLLIFFCVSHNNLLIRNMITLY